MAVIGTCAYAAPSRMRPITVIDPSGQPVTAIPMGDEHNHYYVDAEGNRINWIGEVNRPKTTPAMRKRAQNEAKTGLPAYPIAGERPYLIVLVEFTDTRFSFADPKEEFEALLKQKDYDRYKGKGSVLDYFRDNSNGAFNPVFDVIGPVQMSRAHGYYGSGSDDSAAGFMVIEACEAIDQTVDFSRYDLDKDGAVDNVYFFYAGKGEADGGDVSTIWPHAWTLTEQGRSLTLDNVRIDAYACSPELDGENKPNGIGTFCHEFSHVLGLPDLYASAYTGALHPDTWSLMASGNYNDDGRRPPGLSSYERYELGWLVPQEISYPCSPILPPLNENKAYRISTERTNEYFLFENRQQTGWDSSLPGHGMLVWHIDYNPNIWDRNVVNNQATHQYVDIVEANNATSHNQDAGFTFPGQNNVTKFTADTRPALKSWANVPIDLPLTEISEDSSGTIRFNVAGGKEPVGEIRNLEVKDIEMESCRLEWSAVKGAVSYMVRVSSTDGGEAFSATSTTAENSFTVRGLWPERTYVAEVCAQDIYESGEAAYAEIVMPRADFMHRIPQVLPASEVGTDRFTANWECVEEATSYLLSVNKLDIQPDKVLMAGFDDRNMPEGWTMTDCAWSSIEGYYGASAPSLRMTGNSTLTLSAQGESLYEITFYLRGSSQSTGSVLSVTTVTENGETALIDEIYAEPTARTVTIGVDKRTVTTVTISFDPAKQGAVAYIDDVRVTTSRTESVPESDWSGWDVGNVDSVVVPGLTGGSLYSYSVTPVQDTLTGLTSQEEFVETKTDSSVIPIIGDDTGLVNVYSPSGALIRANVEAAKATSGLAAGVYIIGNKKVIVK